MGGKLHLRLGWDDAAFAHWDWGALELRHLTSLTVHTHPGNVLASIARAKMPLLRTADLPFGYVSSAAGVKAFAAAFPALRELELKGPLQVGPVDDAVIEALSNDLVPLLEVLEWVPSWRGYLETLESCFLPQGPAGDTPRWPRLRSLNMPLVSLATGAYQVKFFTALAHAAPHCPALSSLEIMFHEVDQTAVEAFAAAAVEVGAWPGLRKIKISGFDGDDFDPQPVRDVWPAVTMKQGWF